ncbi:MAG: phytoene desaturase [Flavobacterium sp.]|nr:phytoene desaturase [Flavobacterium sp.]
MKVIIIGSGFSGLSAAAFLAKAGCEVTVVEKNKRAGGRASTFSANGFTFDMGPSWYWMPDVFDRFFAQFGKKTSDYYSLKRLDPSYRVYWPEDYTDLPADYSEMRKTFSGIEPGSDEMLDKYLAEAEVKYDVGMTQLVYKPGQSLMEFADWNVVKNVFKLDLLTSIKSHVRKHFKDRKLQQIMEFPVLFLGALPKNTPALYSLMNYADIKGGTWYPSGGMYSIVVAMQSLCEELGVKFIFDEPVSEIKVEAGVAKSVVTSKNTYAADSVVSSADYHFTEQNLLAERYRNYNQSYWESRTLAPSCLIFYVGLDIKIDQVLHHSLFFDVPFNAHADDIYVNEKWPDEPLFYMCAPSQTDPTVAPEGCENLFILIPISSGLTDDTEETRDLYFDKIVDRLKQRLGVDIKKHIIYKRSYATTDFISDYNAFKGNAYGLANTLKQTALLKPSCRSKKVSNLFFTGQFTVPGPGVPPALISGEVAAKEVLTIKRN